MRSNLKLVPSDAKINRSKYSDRDLDLIFSRLPTRANAKLLAKRLKHCSPVAIEMIWIFATRPKHVFTRDLDNFNQRIRAAKRRMGWVL